MGSDLMKITILTAEQVRILEDLALNVRGTDDLKALEIVAEDLAQAVLTATGWNQRFSVEYEASRRAGRPMDWEAVDV